MNTFKHFACLIPARGGSKRLPFKNTKLLRGKPLIAHSIEHALANGFEGNCFVSTDDESISKVAEAWGATVLHRPPHLAEDTTTTLAVLQYHLNEWSSSDITPNAVVLLQATNPMRPVNLLQDALAIFKASGRDSLVTFSSLNRKFGKISNNHFYPENYKEGQRMQDIEKLYFENGLLYITKSSAIIRGEIITADCWPMLVDSIHSRVDIDEMEDLILAECLMQLYPSYETLY